MTVKTIAMSKELLAIDPKEFRETLKKSGWDTKTVGVRWGKTTRRIAQIVADYNRPLYLGDALRHLSTLPPEPSKLALMESTAFKELIKEKGWRNAELGARWGLTVRRIDQIIAEEDRPAYFDDALNGLPKKRMAKRV